MKTLNFKKTIFTAAVALSLISCRDDIPTPTSDPASATKISKLMFRGENVGPSGTSSYNWFRAEYDGLVLKRLIGLDPLNPNQLNSEKVEFEYNSNGLFSKKEYFFNFGNAYQESTVQTFTYDSQNRLQIENVGLKGIYQQDAPPAFHHKLEYFYTPDSKIQKIAVTYFVSPNSGQAEVTRNIYFTYNGLNVSKIDATAYNGKIYEYTVNPNRTISHNFLPDLYRFDLEMRIENIFRYPLYKNSNVVSSVKITNTTTSPNVSLTSSSDLVYFNNSINQNLLSKVMMFDDGFDYVTQYWEFQYNQ